jgi:SAM-dependent methyltransferase
VSPVYTRAVSELTGIEAIIYNEGERLIPGVTHDRAELVRHRSSYVFWRRIIEIDRAKLADRLRNVSIVDLGCGVGHGCVTLAEIFGARVVGVDRSAECLRYAREHYARNNIEYVWADLVEFIPEMPPFDYAVSRGAMEHITNGLELTRKAAWRNRLMFDVPYDEDAGVNPHHVVHNVREDAFACFDNAEIFFQDLAGVTYDARTKPERPNMIMCISSRSNLPRVSRKLRFPLPAWPDEPPASRGIGLLRRLISGART